MRPKETKLWLGAVLGLALLLIPACSSFGGDPASAVHTLIVEPDDGRSAILTGLAGAKTSVDLTIYTLSDPTIEAAMKTARASGASVRVLYNYHSFPEYKRALVTVYMSSLEAAGIETKPATAEFAVTHQKTFTFDAARSLIMTFNLEEGYFGGTRDFGVLTTDPAEVAEIGRVFAADWAYAPVTPEVGSLVWSNVNSRAKLLTLIRGAAKTIDVYNEELEDRECLDALTAEAAAGVAVRVISAQLGGSGEADGNRVHREYLNAHGVAAKFMPNPYLYCHAKMVLADYGTANARVFLGSENFSSTSLDRNRELGILLTESAILGRLHDTFETDWPLCAFD